MRKTEHEQAQTILGMIEECLPVKSFPLPSEWAEANIVLQRAYSAKPGRLSFENSPFWREVLDCFHPFSPVRVIAVMKSSQVGFSQCVLEPVIGYTIMQNPQSIIYASANKEMAEKNMDTRISALLASAGAADKLRPVTYKKKNQRSGDTKSIKEFDGGQIMALGAQNANAIRQFSASIGLLDEVETFKDDPKHGDMVALFMERFKAFEKTMKVLMGSSPLADSESKIRAAFKQGDQRFFYVPCPECGEMQRLVFGGKDEECGLKWELNSNNELIHESVYYKCVNGCVIKEYRKYKMLIKGEWRPSAIPKKKNYRSYHINALYSNFSSWPNIIEKFLSAKNNKKHLQIFVNNSLGETWHDDTTVIDHNKIMKNKRPYSPGKVPNFLSEKDGNGKIVVLTAAVDVNAGHGDGGGWLALEIKGHCKNMQTYSIAKAEIHGNIDTGGSAWYALSNILDRTFKSEEEKTPRGESWSMDYRINICTIDSGYNTKSVYWYCNNQVNAVPIKGRDKISKSDKTVMKTNGNQGDLWNVDTIYYKNGLVDYIKAMWPGNPIDQPVGFLNFPLDRKLGGLESSDFEPKYGVVIAGNGYDEEYFKTYSSEEPIIQVDDDDNGVVVGWRKRHSRANNHFWDVAVYNFAALDIYLDIIAKECFKVKNASPHAIMGYLSDYLETNLKQFG